MIVAPIFAERDETYPLRWGTKSRKWWWPMNNFSMMSVSLGTDGEARLLGPSSLYAFRIPSPLTPAASPADKAFVQHLYWGPIDASFKQQQQQLPNEDGEDGEVDSLVPLLSKETVAATFDPYIALPSGEHLYESRNTLMLEMAPYGSGDFRSASLELEVQGGGRVTQLEFLSAEVVKGKPASIAAAPADQPAVYVESEAEATSLCVTLVDPLVPGLSVQLWYTVMAEYDVVVRRMVVVNKGAAPVVIKRINAATVDFPVAQSEKGYGFTSLSGSWARERQVSSSQLGVMGTRSISSRRGASSHQHSPFAVISDG